EIAPDGCVFHRGRKDFQVKIRGNRVNILEVEAALLEIDGVCQAAAVARNKEHEVILVGYLEGREKDSKAVRHALEGKIPAAMIPSRFVFMDSLPRTLTGKIDRRSLPLPEDDHSSISETEIDASELTETDIQILEIWKDVLVIDRIGINDHFLDLGGDSLKAMMVLGRLNQHFEIKLRLRDLFDAPTVSQIAELIQPLLNPGSP
ncbi:MAG: non-ribosomal peptide synthetase, partial [Verrucomicrobiae bacterium]|nr:non-ribosomal peptide synthetase [Verrucomicrobiae bacterium]